MGATFSRVKTWTAEVLTAADLNAEFNNILNNLTPAGVDDESANLSAMQATTDPYPAGSEDLATSLQGEIQRLRYLIKQITGESQWYIDPDNSLINTASNTFANVTTTTATITDTVSERTSAAGVTVDGVLLKDSQVTTDVINEKTGAAGVTIDSLLIKDGGISDGTNIIKTKIVDIGDWNMDSTASKSVAHGLTLGNIRDVSVAVRNDANSSYSIADGNPPGTAPDGSVQLIYYIDGTNVVMSRYGTGSYDHVDYDATSYNRGWITITYVV